MAEKINWHYLIEKFRKSTCTKEEFDQLLELVQQDQDNEGLTQELRNYWGKAKDENTSSTIDWEEKFSSMLREAKDKAPVIPLYRNKKKVRLMKWAAVASVLLLLSVGRYFSFNNNPFVQISKTNDRPVKRNNEIFPGGNKAILTLADGSTINLDSAKNGTLASQGNIKIIKGEDGELLYYVDRQNPIVTGYNTIATPRGGKYEIVLSDGSKVWLNAASSLKFPTSFKGKARDVTLTGEGYFEVAHISSSPGGGREEAIPFIVTIASPLGDGSGMIVEVLGTHFNVNAYNDENSVATTLLEGSVKVKKAVSTNSDLQTVLLKPGEQADLLKEGSLKVNHSANLEEVVAWKDDNFEFNDTAIPAIMRQVSRWYDVEVDYKGSMPERRFTGKISRNVNLSQLIEMLQYTGVNMKVENKRIVIWES